MSANESQSVITVADEGGKKKKREPEDNREPLRGPPVINTEPAYTDQQMLGITQNMHMELAKLAFQQLNFSSATAVQAYAGILDQMAKNAQANIRSKQEAEIGGAVGDVAARIAQMFSSIDRNSTLPLRLNEPDDSIEAPVIEGDSSSLMENVPGVAYIGTEDLNKDDFITPAT